MHLLEAAGARISRSTRASFRAIAPNPTHSMPQLPFDARRIDGVVLSHAHIDHSGPAFRSWCEARLSRADVRHPSHPRPRAPVMLADAANIQEKDHEFLQRNGRSGPESEPLYTLRDAIAVQDLMVGVPYRRVFASRKHLALEFLERATFWARPRWILRITEGGNHRLVFSGDIGRSGLPIVRDPEPPSGPIDTLIVESTYADRHHESLTTRKRGWPRRCAGWRLGAGSS